jgi:cobalt-zinc-cadmium efflux system outer membrane protein
LKSLISQNPDVARWVTEAEQRRAQIELERTKRIPDPTLSLGPRHFNGIDEHAFVFAFSIPLPFFDRNQGSLLEAQERLNKAEEESKATKLRVFGALAEAYQSLSAAYSEAETLRNDVLRGAQEVFEASREGYRQGKFDYLMLLDAQRTLFEVRGQYIEALGLYHQAVADVERLIGRGFDGLTEMSQEKQ